MSARAKRVLTKKYVGVICLNDFPERLTKACSTAHEADELAGKICLELRALSGSRSGPPILHYHHRVLELPTS